MADTEKTKREPLKLINEAVNNWLETSSSHALPNIARSRSRFLTLAWIIVFVFSFAYCTYLLVRLILEFLKYETSIQLTVIRDSPTEFPTVSICNLNPYNLIYTEASDYMTSVLEANNLTDYVDAADAREYPNFLTNIKRIIATDTNKDDEYRKYYLGFDLKEQMLLSCFFNKMVCNASQFSYFWSNDYGNCYTFNSGKNENNSKQEIFNTSRASSNFGLHLEILVADPAYDASKTQFSYKKGLLVIIHNRTTPIEQLSYGIDVATGFETYIPVKRTFYKKLPAPYSNCMVNLKAYQDITDYSKKLYGYMKNLNQTEYSEEFCYDLCLQDTLTNECGCCEINIPLLNGKSYCKNQTELKCLEKVLAKFSTSNNEELCKNSCPPQCESIVYDLSDHAATYPSDFYYTQLVNVANKSNSGPVFKALNESITYLKNASYTDSDIIQFVKESIVKIVVNYDDLTYTRVEDVPSMTFERFMGELGGQLGLFIGISFLSVVEVIDLLYALIVACCKKNKDDKKAEFNGIPDS